MEKFYMEDNNKRGKQSIWNVSVVLSFAVAIFFVATIAITGLSVIQKTGVSYAAPVTKDTFTLKMGKKVFAYDNPSSMTKAYVMETYYYDTVNTDNAVFCIERNRGVVNNDEYTKTDTARTGADAIKDDAGLLYLLGIGTNADSLKAVTTYDDEVDIWTVQSAIWYYLNGKYGSTTDATNVYNLVVGEDASSYINDKAVMDINGDVYLSFVDDVTAMAPGTFAAYKGLTGPNGKIMELVNAAKTKVGSEATITVTKSSNSTSKTEDGKYYQSSLITVTGSPSSNFNNYDIELSGIEGAIAVDENGNTLTLTNVPAGTKFYVRIPADKVTKEVKKLSIKVTGSFENVITYYYVPSSEAKQRLASLGAGTPATGGIEVEFVGPDDTGMSTVQTIYFIGLIVLLCGVGIVYANAKPVQVKQ